MKELNLRFLNSSDNESVPFLPYGVASIEFAIEGKCEAGEIRPKNSTLHDPLRREYVGFTEDKNEDFLVVWGAGNQFGQHVKEDSTDRMFMQLIHLRGDHDEATIVFKHSVSGREKKLKICKPKTAPAMNDIFKMVTEANGSNSKTTSLEGTYLPMYYSRWFPPKEIEYVNPNNYPQIHIDYKEDESGINSPIDIFSKTQGQNTKICTVKGDLRYSRLHMELFALLQNKSIFVLRLWLYWIHKRYVKGLLSASADDSVDDESHELGFVDQVTGLEIPDIERFDFVIDAEKNKIILYGTDIHYQEYWGKVKSPLVKARIAGHADLFSVTAALYPLRFLQDSNNYNPIAAVKEYILDGMKNKRFQPVVVKRKEPEISRTLGKVNIRAHVPYIEHGTTGEKSFLSSDSRQGVKI